MEQKGSGREGEVDGERGWLRKCSGECSLALITWHQVPTATCTAVCTHKGQACVEKIFDTKEFAPSALSRKTSTSSPTDRRSKICLSHAL